MPQFVSPKQVARAIGVSESSLKRWCDSGLIPTVRTAGGHRKLSLTDVLQFIRDRNFKVVNPQLLSLPSVSPHSERGLVRGLDRLTEALLAGDEPLAQRIVSDLYLARHPLSQIFDEVLAPAFHQIGERWMCAGAEVYEERRGCEIARRILGELRRTVPVVSGAPGAIGGTLEGDPYSLAPAMAELVLREAGWSANLLGTSIPAKSFAEAVRRLKPRLCWLSLSALNPEVDRLRDVELIVAAAGEVGAQVVVGGRGATPTADRQFGGAAWCDSMQDLERTARIHTP